MTTYAAMRAQFVDLLNNTEISDPNDSRVKGWFDASIVRIMRELRAPHMERVLTIDTSLADIDTIIIPNDYLQTKAFIYTLGDSTSGEVQALELGDYYRLAQGRSFGVPTYYCRRYDRWLVADPVPKGSTALIIYYGEEPPLVNDTDETTLAKIAPDLIVYGALTYAADYFSDPRGDQWEAKWQVFRDQLQSQSSEGDNYNGSNAVQAAYEFDDGV